MSDTSIAVPTTTVDDASVLTPATDPLSPPHTAILVPDGESPHAMNSDSHGRQVNFHALDRDSID